MAISAAVLAGSHRDSFRVIPTCVSWKSEGAAALEMSRAFKRAPQYICNPPPLFLLWPAIPDLIQRLAIKGKEGRYVMRGLF